MHIVTDSPDPSNSLASNISQVTVVTTHPPVLIDAVSTPPPRRSSPSSEVVIVANETNKTQVNESSGDDDGFPSLDSLEFTPQEQPIVVTDVSKRIGKKLDDSEVVIVSPVVDELQVKIHCFFIFHKKREEIELRFFFHGSFRTLVTFRW